MTPWLYPIIYIRGYAKSVSERDETSADPFCGFNVERQTSDNISFHVVMAKEAPFPRIFALFQPGATDNAHPSRKPPLFSRCDLSETAGKGEPSPRNVSGVSSTRRRGDGARNNHALCSRFK